MDQSDADFRDIERAHELPPDELHPRYVDDDGEEPCEHDTTKIIRVYQERREVCCNCERTLRTAIVPWP